MSVFPDSPVQPMKHATTPKRARKGRWRYGDFARNDGRPRLADRRSADLAEEFAVDRVVLDGVAEGPTRLVEESGVGGVRHHAALDGL